jgi:FdhD protein
VTEEAEKVHDFAHVASVLPTWRKASTTRVSPDGAAEAARDLPAATAVAITVNGATEAVLMATPADLPDFGIGFLLTEGLVSSPRDVEALEVVEAEGGVEVRLWLAPGLGAAHSERRRRLVGPTGCGLCGIESLEAALRPPRPIAASAMFRLSPSEIFTALGELEAAQTLGARTRAVHGASFHAPGGGLVAVKEDVGRHNALDKLVGGLALQGVRGEDGFVVLTSRISVEMVQKTCALGAPALIAVSAPTTLALDLADKAGLTLIGVARPDAFEVFCDPAGRLR